MTRMRRRASVPVATLLLVVLLSPIAASGQALPEIASARTINEGGVTTVIVEATGALPMPTPGSLDNPPRLFFDFEGTTPKRRGVSSMAGAGVVRQTRTELHAANRSEERR